MSVTKLSSSLDDNYYHSSYLSAANTWITGTAAVPLKECSAAVPLV